MKSKHPTRPHAANLRRHRNRWIPLAVALAFGLVPALLLLGIAAHTAPIALAEAATGSVQPSAIGSQHAAQRTQSAPLADPPFLQVSYPISRGVTPRLGSLPQGGNHPADPGKHPPIEHRPTNATTKFGKHPEPASGNSPAQPSAPSATMPGLIADIEGISNLDGLFPPDTEGDIGYDPATGKKYYFQWVNIHYAVWDVTVPATPTLVISPTAGNILWSTALPGSQCGMFNDGDPIALFDEQAHRWLISQFAVEGEFHQCIAVSQSADPTGAWNIYDYQYADGATFFNDYAKFGVWPDPVYNAYYMTVNQFDPATFGSLGAGIAAFDRASLLAGAAAPAMLLFNLNAISPSFDNLLPADLDGTPPPSGTPGIVLSVDDNVYKSLGADALRIWEYRPNWAHPLSSTFGVNGTPNYTLPVASFNVLPCTFAGTAACIPQQDTTRRIDGIGDRLMYRAAFRAFTTTQSLVVNHTVLADGTDRAGVRWYELNRNPGTGGWSVNQQQTYAPADGLYRWMGSVAMDRQGDMAVGYSASSANDFPSIRYAGRLLTDTLSTLPQTEVTLTAGTGAQTGATASDPAGRWGDYSMMGVDPQNGCTFWYTNEYVPVTSDADWHTRIGAFAFPQCVPIETGSITGTVVRASNSAPISGSLVVALDASGLGTYSSRTNAAGRYQLLGIPAGAYTVTASAFGFTSATVSAVGVIANLTATQNFSLTALPQADLAVTVVDTPDPVYAGSTLTYTVSITNNGSDAVTATAGLTATLPAGAGFGGATGAGWACTPAAGVVLCTRPGLPLGAASPVVITLTAPITPGISVAQARISGDGSFDLNPPNDSSTISTTVRAMADLSISVTSPAFTPPGVIVYKLTIGNAGPSLIGLSTVTVSNAANIVINDDAVATPYPATLDINGLTPVLTATASLNNFNHTFPGDVDVLLVAPGGEQTFLMSDAGGGGQTAGADLTFDDSAPAGLPCTSTPLVTGAYHPTDCTDIYGNDLLPSPAPVGPYVTTTSVFNGANPNGTWRLFARDDFPGDNGFIGSGWSLSLTTDRAGMVVTDTLPAGALFVGASGAGWSCTPIGSQVRCLEPGFAFGIAPSLILTATPPSVPGIFTNTVMVASTAYDPLLVNNQAVVTGTLYTHYLMLIMR